MPEGELWVEDEEGVFPELEAARELAPRVRDAAALIDQTAELPCELVHELTSAGMFRLILPRRFGGSELPLPCFLRCVEVIARADGSTGWCVGQGGVFPNLADRMLPETAAAIWVADPAAVVATGTPFGCRAVDLGDRYRLTGHWRFASGCLHASWLAAMADIVSESGDTKGFGMFLVPRAEITLGEGWNVRGMRGTGSREYTLDELTVPAERALLGRILSDHGGAATRLPAQLLFASVFGAVGLGIARGALDTLMALIQGKTPAFSNRRLLDDDLVHAGLGAAEAAWGEARAFLYEVARRCERARAGGGAPGRLTRARLRLAATNAMRKSGEIVDQAYRLAGTDAIFTDHPLHRCFQDIHALTQQIQARPAHFRTVGRVLLGLEPDAPVL